MIDSSPNFYDATTKHEKQVKVGGGIVTARTLSCLPFTKLGLLREKLGQLILDKGDPTTRATIVWEMLNLGYGGDVEKLDTLDSLPALSALMNINQIPPKLAWQKYKPPKEKIKNAIEMIPEINYEGRDLAWVVTLLSTVFGWTSYHVLYELTYYEVACYVQEAMLIQHQQQEFQYTLSSEVGVKKVGSEYVKEPYPQLSWAVGRPRLNPEAPKGKLPAWAAPDGVVIDFTQYRQTGEVSQYEVAVEKKDDSTHVTRVEPPDSGSAD